MTQKAIRILVRLTWVFVIGVIFTVFSVFKMVENDTFGWFGGLPSLNALERPNPDLSSELISSDGVSLGKYFRKNRTPVTYDELSAELINTLLVTEDIRFKNHPGIDLRGFTRAVIGKLTFSFQGGGSTITMQLAENLYKTNSTQKGSLYRYPSVGELITKVKEWIIAVQLERAYTKEEILAMYLNTIEYGSNSYGIKVAAQTFFNKLPAQLDYQEAASLVGSINKPTAFNPVYNPERAKRKRTEVLYNVHKYGLIDRATFDSLNHKELALNYLVESQNEGLATYFRTVAKNYLVSWARQNGYDLFEDGLKIYTTIDSRMQAYAEAAIASHMDTLQSLFDAHWEGKNPWINDDNKEIPEFLDNVIKRTQAYKSLAKTFGETSDSVAYYLHLKKPMKVFSWKGEIDTLFSSYDSLNYYKRFLQTGFMAMNPQSGHIKAWVGGVNHKYFKYDHVKQGKRQPGSTFKPFVYTAAIDNGWSPCQTAVDAPVSFPMPGNQEPWVPKNSNGKFSDKVLTFKEAMAKSVNSITAWIMNKVTPGTVVDYARRLGIESPLDAVPSLCLGAGGDVSLFEVIGAYATFANKGTHIRPFFISRIEDKNGNIIRQFIPNEREAIDEETAYIMLQMLKETVAIGSGRGLADSLKINNDIGAKTGTTQNASDGWFIGVTKHLVAGAWVGGDDRSIRFREWYLGQGGRTALPIFEKFMLSVYDDQTLGVEKAFFDKPSKPLSTVIACDLYDETTQDGDTTQLDIVEEGDFM